MSKPRYRVICNRRNRGAAQYRISVRKLLLNPNLVKSHLPIAYLSVMESVWNLIAYRAQQWCCRALCIFCKSIGQRRHELWASEISRNLGFRWVSDRLPYIAQHPKSFWSSAIWFFFTNVLLSYCAHRKADINKKNGLASVRFVLKIE